MSISTPPQAVAISELLALSLAATQGDWRWSENGNIVTDTPNPGCDSEIAAVYSEHMDVDPGDCSEPANSAFVCALVRWFRTNAATLAAPARVVSDADAERVCTDYETAVHGYKNFVPNQMAIDAMKAALSTLQSGAEGKDGWISVKDRTPPEDTPVWCSISDGEPFVGGYCFVDGDEASGWAWHTCENSHFMNTNGEWEADDFIWDDQYDVTHWQPLPTEPAALQPGQGTEK